MVDSADGRPCRQQRDLLRLRRRERVGDRASRRGPRSRRLRRGTARRGRAQAPHAWRVAARQRRPPRAAQSAATRSKTSARSIRSGWPGGVTWAPNRGDAMRIMYVLRSTGRAPGPRASPASVRAPDVFSSTVASVASGTDHRLPIATATVAKGLGIWVRSQLGASQKRLRFDVKRQDRMAGRARQPHGTGLRDARRPARPVHREPDRPARRPDRAASGPARAPRRATSIRAPFRSRSARGSRRSTRRRSSGW